MAFAEQNPWVKNDKQLTRTFARELKLIIDTKTADSFEEAFQQAKDEVMRRHPDRFRRAPARSMAETGGDSTGIGGGKNQTWANLKPEYRQQAEADVAAGQYTKAHYPRKLRCRRILQDMTMDGKIKLNEQGKAARRARVRSQPSCYARGHSRA